MTDDRTHGTQKKQCTTYRDEKQKKWISIRRARIFEYDLINGKMSEMRGLRFKNQIDAVSRILVVWVRRPNS